MLEQRPRNKTVLVDINHPGQVHLFRHFIHELQEREWDVTVTVKDVPAATELLKKYQISYIKIGKKTDSIAGKVLFQLKYNREILRLVRQRKIAFGVGSSISVAHVSKMTPMVSFIFDDDDAAVQPLFARFAHPFADYIVTPDALAFENYGAKHLVYPGYHELAYLHPTRFTPDITVLHELGVQEGEPFFVLRFNAFKAHHDIGATGLSLNRKRELIGLLRDRGHIFITTEKEIEPEFEAYRLNVSPEKIHSLLYYATMFIGDSQTMTSEAALLGTPAVKCNSFAGRLAVPNEIEQRYELCYGFLPARADEMFRKVISLLVTPNLKSIMKARLSKLLVEKVDVTAFMVRLLERFPQSIDLAKKENDAESAGRFPPGVLNQV